MTDDLFKCVEDADLLANGWVRKGDWWIDPLSKYEYRHESAVALLLSRRKDPDPPSRSEGAD